MSHRWLLVSFLCLTCVRVVARVLTDSHCSCWLLLHVLTTHVSCLPKAELPPPYTAIASPDTGGVPVINCRVCESLINLEGKLHQHVVKCTVCNEASVSEWSAVLTSHRSSLASYCGELKKSCMFVGTFHSLCQRFQSGLRRRTEAENKNKQTLLFMDSLCKYCSTVKYSVGWSTLG